MTINLTDPVNHPANGLLAIERIIRVREELQRTLWHKNDSTIDYVTADAIKALDELLVSRAVQPAMYCSQETIAASKDGEHLLRTLSYPSGDCIIPLYTAPPAPQSSKMSGIMPDYEGVAMTQRECYMAGKEAGLSEARKSPVTPDGWIPVSERLPEKDGNYWGWWNESKRQGPVWFIKSDVQAQFQSSEITHWQPLPAAPQEVKDE